MLLGVIVRDITDPFFAGAIEAVSIEASRRGYNVVLGHAHGRAHEAIELRVVLDARHCDAIVLLGDMGDQPRLLEDLKGAHVPVVALWQGSRAAGIPTVNVDNRAGINAVLEHLIGLGHRRIGFIGGRRLGDIREREEAFASGVAALGESGWPGYLQYVGNEPAGGVEAIRRMLDLPEPPTAVVAATDVLAIGALHGAYEKGRTVPDQLSITGFDDIPLASVTVPALTTVRMPTREMMGTAVSMLIEESGSPVAPGRTESRVLKPSLVVRGSTGPVQATSAGGDS
jgi:DNA-binding LacI/PurR family transcriptional regulator